MTEPMRWWKHDCEKCVFLGHYDRCDLYFCPPNKDRRRPPDIIARYGDEPHEYASGLASEDYTRELTEEHSDHSAHLRVALLIARDKGLMPKPPATPHKMLQVIKGLMEIAELAMPDTYFRTDSRVCAAREIIDAG